VGGMSFRGDHVTIGFGAVFEEGFCFPGCPSKVLRGVRAVEAVEVVAKRTF
jgi:hypothetical protein